MRSKSISFKNRDGIELSGKADLPADKKPHAWAILAHCFTCSKNLSALKNISRGLTSNGFAVLRFDFTGLGNSEGDFSNTGFSANINDLIDAAEMLRQDHQAPALLVGHSLGGAAVLVAARWIPEVKAVVTIGAPSHPSHVLHLLKEGMETILKTGSAVINIGGRDFRIRKKFLDDLEGLPSAKLSSPLRLPLLLMHSPEDQVVGIENARDLYEAASHPKNFICLDGADHLLTNESDSRFTGNLAGSWAKRYISPPEPPVIETAHQVAASLDPADKFTTEMFAGNHAFLADEPESSGGADLGPTPYDLLSAALASCTAMTIRMYLDHKNLKVELINVFVSYSREHRQDCEDCKDPNARIDQFEREIHIRGDIDPAFMKRIEAIANKCPVHKTLVTDNFVETRILMA